jgi:hypothetical protein
MNDKELKDECMENAEIDLRRYSNSELTQIREAMRMYAERKLKLFAIPDVMASVSDELLLRAGRYEDEANADFDTEGVQHNLNIGRYDGLMQAVQEINKHLP